MISKLVGFRRFQYKRKSDGQTVDACNLYITYPGNADVVGDVAETVFCKSDIVPKDLKVGDNLQVFYNRFGSVESVDNKF